MAVALAPITAEDIPAVADFLHDHLNQRVSAADWTRALLVPWQVTPPNHGFFLARRGRCGRRLPRLLLRSGEVDGRTEQFCNLGAWCVLESHRHQGLRLLTTLLKQKGYHFTDFSPSGNVVPLNRRLKFTDLDTTTALIPNLPLPPGWGGVRISERPDVLLARLSARSGGSTSTTGTRPRPGTWCSPRRGEHCYVVFRKDSRKHVRAFASVLYASDPGDVPPVRAPGGQLTC